MADANKQSCSFCSGTGEVSSPPHSCLRNLPPGYAFNPTDEDLIRHYLYPKNRGTELPPNLIIENDVYEAHPEELTKKFEPNGDGPSWYFFFVCRLKAIGFRPDPCRTVYATGTNSEVGYWRTFHFKNIVVKDTSGNNIVKGKKLWQKFYESSKNSTKKRKYTKTDWLMNEYWSFNLNPEDVMGNMMLCKMFKKGSRNCETEPEPEPEPESEPEREPGTHMKVNDAANHNQPGICTSPTESEEVDQPLK